MTKTTSPAAFTVQFRNMSRVYAHTSLASAIKAGHADSAVYGAFDVSTTHSGAIVWVWEQRP